MRSIGAFGIQQAQRQPHRPPLIAATFPSLGPASKWTRKKSASKSVLLRTLSPLDAQKRRVLERPVLYLKWCATADEDGHDCFAVAL